MMDSCDKCGRSAELFYNEESGLAYCESCDEDETNEETILGATKIERALRGEAAITAYGNGYALALAHSDERTDFEDAEDDRAILVARFPGGKESALHGYSDGFRAGIKKNAPSVEIRRALDSLDRFVRRAVRAGLRAEVSALAPRVMVVPADGGEDGRMYRVLDRDGNDVGEGLFPDEEGALMVAREIGRGLSFAGLCYAERISLARALVESVDDDLWRNQPKPLRDPLWQVREDSKIREALRALRAIRYEEIPRAFAMDALLSSLRNDDGTWTA
jgi:hypothetical protein